MLSKSLLKPSIEFRHLQSFLVVAEELSFSRAAERLGISQPPLSRQIQRLEAKLDIQLFDRSRSQVQLTDAGLVFAQSARQVMRQIEQGVRDAKQVSQGLMGQLMVAVDGDAFACDRAIQLISAYQAGLPELHLQVEELNATAQIEALQLREIHLGFVASRFVAATQLPKGIMAAAVVRERLAVAFPVSHVLAISSQISLLDLADEAFVIAPSWLAYVRSLAKTHHHIDFNPPVTQSIQDYRLMLSFVAAGKGISIVPASTEQRFHYANVIYRPLQLAPEADILSVIWCNEQTNPSVAASIKALTQVEEMTQA